MATFAQMSDLEAKVATTLTNVPLKVSKLGIRADRDRICIGLAVEQAAKAQEKCKGTEIGLPSNCSALLPENLQQHFRKDAERQLYLAGNLTAEKLESAARAAAYASGSVFLKSTGAGVNLSSTKSSGAREGPPSKSWTE